MSGENTQITEEDLLGMSDEDFMQTDLSSVTPSESETPEDPQVPEETALVENTQVEDTGSKPEENEDPNEQGEDPAKVEQGADPADTAVEAGQPDEKTPDDVKDPSKVDGEKKADEKPAETKTEEKIDFEAAYKELMKPFKANGQLFTPQSPEELVKLAQMGANYSKKMNGLKPHLKTVRMLEENGVLDDAKLSYLIDLNNGNPDAIKKLLKDHKVDPLDVDTSGEDSYKPTDRRISDEQYNFTETVKEVAQSPEGKAMIRIAHQEWDPKSKEILFEDPNILRVMFQQKQSGIYDQVAAEINRRQILGELRETPFLEAYRTVGEEMTRQGRFANVAAKEPSQGQTPSSDASQRVVARGPVTRQPVANNDKVKAATPPKSRPSTKPPEINPLALSDDEFEKQAAMGARFS